MMFERRASVDGYASERVVEHAAWSPAQIVALVVGLVFLIIGGIALARTGVHFSPAQHAVVAGLGHTAVLAIIELVFGLVTLAVGAVPGADRGGMIFFGIIALAGGIIVGVQHASFYSSLGTTAGNGWFYAIAGAVLLIAGLTSPVFRERRSVATRTARRDDIA